MADLVFSASAAQPLGPVGISSTTMTLIMNQANDALTSVFGTTRFFGGNIDQYGAYRHDIPYHYDKDEVSFPKPSSDTSWMAPSGTPQEHWRTDLLVPKQDQVTPIKEAVGELKNKIEFVKSHITVDSPLVKEVVNICSVNLATHVFSSYMARAAGPRNDGALRVGIDPNQGSQNLLQFGRMLVRDLQRNTVNRGADRAVQYAQEAFQGEPQPQNIQPQPQQQGQPQPQQQTQRRSRSYLEEEDSDALEGQEQQEQPQEQQEQAPPNEEAMNTAAQNFVAMANDIKGYLVGGGALVGAFAKNSFEACWSALKNILGWVGENIGEISEAVKNAAQMFYDAVHEALMIAIEVVKAGAALTTLLINGGKLAGSAIMNRIRSNPSTSSSPYHLDGMAEDLQSQMQGYLDRITAPFKAGNQTKQDYISFVKTQGQYDILVHILSTYAPKFNV